MFADGGWSWQLPREGDSISFSRKVNRRDSVELQLSLQQLLSGAPITSQSLSSSFELGVKYRYMLQIICFNYYHASQATNLSRFNGFANELARRRTYFSAFEINPTLKAVDEVLTHV